METIDKKGRILTRADIEAAAKRGGVNVLFVVDTDVSELLKEIIKQLKQANKYLSNLD